MASVCCRDSTRMGGCNTRPACGLRRDLPLLGLLEKGDSSMLQEFKAFIAKGNVIDLAVAVIIGAAFGAIVTSLTEEVITPLIGAIFGGTDFSNYFILLAAPEGYQGSLTDYAALKEAGAAMIGYGAFITAVINFLIMAFIIFLLVRYLKKVMAEFEKKEEAAPAGP